MKYRPLVALCVYLAMSSPARSEEQIIVCPPQIHPADVRITGAPSKWVAGFVGQDIALHGASLMHGPPADLAILQPTGAGASNEDVWTDMRPVPDGFWMACMYGKNQEFILSQRLPDATKECRIRYKGLRAGRLEMDIRCR